MHNIYTVYIGYKFAWQFAWDNKVPRLSYGVSKSTTETTHAGWCVNGYIITISIIRKTSECAGKDSRY